MKKSFPRWLWAALLVPYLVFAVVIAAMRMEANLRIEGSPRSGDPGTDFLLLCLGAAALSQVIGMIVAICFLVTRRYTTLKNIVTTLFVGLSYAWILLVFYSLGGLR